MDRDDEQLLRRRVYGADYDHPGPRPGRLYAELVGGPLDGLLTRHHRLDADGSRHRRLPPDRAGTVRLRRAGAVRPAPRRPDPLGLGRRHSLTAPADSPRDPVKGTLGGVTSAPIIVHRLTGTGGRRVTVHRQGRDEVLGTAYSDHDLVVFLEGAGVAEPEAILDDPKWVEWRGGHAHEFQAA